MHRKRNVGRRAILRTGALSFYSLHLADFLRARQAFGAEATDKKAKAKSVIMLWLNGGPSHIDMWDPKPNSSFAPISTRVPGIQVSELLPHSSKHLDKISIIRSMRTEENNHGVGHHNVLTGHRPNPSMAFPSLSTMVTKELGPQGSIPPNVMVPRMHASYMDYYRAHFLGPQYDPFQVPDPSAADFEIPNLSIPESVTVERLLGRRSMLDLVDRQYRAKVKSAEHRKMDTFSTQALNMIMSKEVREAFDLSKESEKTKDAYGRDRLGQGTLLARRLVEAGSRFVTVVDLHRPGTGRDWDTHGANDSQHRDHLVPWVDRTLSALLSDLSDRSLLDSTLVLVTGEFGRTYDHNSGAGRDHWCHCWSFVLAGGGIQGGRVVGASDERGAYVADRLVTIGDCHATIYKALGIDWTKEYMHPVGRPLKIANSINDEAGKPLDELF
ncbi:MAG: DUF1501 domain-containing protein [Planctomycetes bacterium]|nr:DUF1501 domain-containing protein [Planctomycetota bacterium]